MAPAQAEALAPRPAARAPRAGHRLQRHGHRLRDAAPCAASRCRFATRGRRRPLRAPDGSSSAVELINVHVQAPHSRRPGVHWRAAAASGAACSAISRRRRTTRASSSAISTPRPLWPLYRRVTAHLRDAAVIRPPPRRPRRPHLGSLAGRAAPAAHRPRLRASRRRARFPVVDLVGGDHSAIVVDAGGADAAIEGAHAERTRLPVTTAGAPALDLDRATAARLSRAGVPRFSMSQITTLDWPFERDVEAFAAAGAPAVGVAIRKLEAAASRAPGGCCATRGLAVSCLTSSGLFPLGDEAGERAALERTRRHLDAGAALGADCLMVLPGSAVGWSWEEPAARARPLLEALLADAERRGVRIAIEPTSQLRMDLAFLHSFDEALDFADAIDSPWLGVVLELNNAWIERRLYENIRAARQPHRVVQVSDFKVGTLAASERVVIGDGDIPLRRICRRSPTAGYDGWYDIELLGPAIEAEGYASVVPRAIARFRALWDETTLRDR